MRGRVVGVAEERADLLDPVEHARCAGPGVVDRRVRSEELVEPVPVRVVDHVAVVRQQLVDQQQVQRAELGCRSAGPRNGHGATPGIEPMSGDAGVPVHRRSGTPGTSTWYRNTAPARSSTSAGASRMLRRAVVT